MILTGKKFSNKRAGLSDFLFVFRKNCWILLVGLMAFLLLIPFSTAGLQGDSIFNIEVTHDQMKFRLFHESVIPVIIGALIILGALNGFALFRFILDKKESTIFLSLGVKRIRLLVNRIAAGCINIFVSCALPMAVSYRLNISALGGYQCLLRNTVFLTLGMFLCAFVSMLIAICCVLLSGTIVEGIVYWSGVMSLPTIICYSVNLLFKQLFLGNPYGEVFYSGASQAAPSLIEKFSISNPITFLLNSLNTDGQFVRPLSTAVPGNVNWKLLIIWAVVCTAFLAASIILISLRKAENAGFTGFCIPMSQGIIILTSFLGWCVVFALLNSYGTFLAICLASLCFLAVNLFWRKTLFNRQVRFVRSVAVIVIQAAVIAAVIIFCSFFFKAQTENFLDHGNIVSACVSFTGDPSLMYGNSSGSSSGHGYYVMSSGVLDSEEGIAKAVQLNREILSAGGQTPGSGDDEKDTVIPYDICFTYVDAAGGEHIWYYKTASYDYLEQALSLEDVEEVKEKRQELLDIDGSSSVRNAQAFRNADVYLSDKWMFNTFLLNLTDEQRGQLLEAIAADIEKLQSEERYFPQSDARAELMFTNTGEQDCRYFTYHLDNAYIYITDSYVNTVSWLDENNLLDAVSSPADIEYVILQKFDPYMGINSLTYPMGMYFMSYCADSDNEFMIQKDFGNQYRITKEDQIAELSEALYNGCYMTRGGYLACVKLQGQDRFRYMFLPEWKVPDFVRG